MIKFLVTEKSTTATQDFLEMSDSDIKTLTQQNRHRTKSCNVEYQFNYYQKFVC